MSNILRDRYYDRYDSSKQYTQLLAVPGRVAQAREITEIQTTIKDIIKNIGNILLSEGSVMEGGCSPSVQRDENGEVISLTISPGKVYINGLVLPVGVLDPVSGVLKDTVIKVGERGFTGKGEEKIGFILKEDIVEEKDDTDLLDPASGYANHLRAGCHRLKSTVEIVINNDDAAHLVTLVDGVPTVQKYAPNYSALESTLARRTNNESGSYIVSGLRVRVESNNEDSDYFNVCVDPGTAYVEGFELPFLESVTLKVKRSIETDTILDTYTYEGTGKDYVLTSDGPHIESIVEVKANKPHEEYHDIPDVPEGLSNGDVIDSTELSMPNAREASIEVEGYDKGTHYRVKKLATDTQGSHYAIEWLKYNDEVVGGDNVTITYDYQTLWSPDNYKLEYDESTGHKLVWVEGEETTPVEGTEFVVTFNKYRARKDIVYLSTEGELGIVEGFSTDYNREVTPQSREHTMTLAIISNPPGGIARLSTEGEDSGSNSSKKLIKVDNVGLTRFTMEDIQKIVDRLKVVEHDQAALSLENAARNDRTINKKGIWVDPLIDFSRMDYTYSRTINGVDAEGEDLIDLLCKFDSTVDTSTSICYLPTLTQTCNLSYDFEAVDYSKVDRNNIPIYTKPSEYTRALTLASTGEETTLLTQPKATEVFYVNPYSTYPELPELSVRPASDSWVEDSIVEVPVSVRSSEIVSIQTRNLSNRVVLGGRFTDYSTASVSDVITEIGTRTTTTISPDVVVSEESAKYIRPRTITITGHKINHNLRKLKCYFDGVLCPLTAIYTTQHEYGPKYNNYIEDDAGDWVRGEYNEILEYYLYVPYDSSIHGSNVQRYSPDGTIRPTRQGHFKATFKIPKNRILTGIREIRIVDEESDVPVSVIRSTSALYTATGTNRLIQRTVTTLTTILLKRLTTITTTTYVDPVGQTFVLSQPALLKGINLYFQDSGNSPVTCEIREVVNGNITSTVYGHRTLDSVNDDGEATRFDFEDPILLESNKEYAFVVRTTSNECSLWVAKLGELDKTTNQPVLTNPYMIGVMMSSSNNSTWTAHQDMDIKFDLIADEYAEESTIYFKVLGDIVSADEEGNELFEDITIDEFSRLYLLAETIVPAGTYLDWEYSLNGVSYKTLSPYSMESLGRMHTNFIVRANLKRDPEKSNPNMSPVLISDSIGVSLSSYDKETGGMYISKNISGLTNYNDVKVVMEEYHTGEGTSIKVYISADNSETLEELTPPSIKVTSGRWVEREYTKEGISVEDATNLRVFIKMDSNESYHTPAFRRLRVIVS